jgi:NAD(P)-dependent dehydrogenase (short-subunit alcohol dehydrogenase family)
MAQRLAGKVALITGAGRGIGQAIALRLAEEGAHVAINDVDEPSARGTAELAEKLGVTAVPAVADVARSDQVAGMIEALLARFGRLDVLVNNCGIIRDNFIQKMPEEDWDLVLAVNLKSVWLCCRAVVPHMIERRSGKIVSVSSRAYMGNPGQTNYSASKAGILGLTRSLALEVGRFGVHVNAVAPGLIDTPLAASLRDDVRQRLIDAQPTRTMGTPRDVAHAVLFLASDEANFITGEVIHVDGGKSIGGRTS